MLPDSRQSDYQYSIPEFNLGQKDDLGHPSGAIIFDETGFVKKGKDSIGVSKNST